MATVVFSTLLFVCLAAVLAISILLARKILVPDTAINITVNGKNRYTARFGQKLLQALSDNDIHIPSACAGAGTCGLCHVHIESGVSLPTPIEKTVLTSNDIVNGERLACQVHLRNALAIEIPSETLNTRSWQSTVLSNRSLSPLIREIRLQPDSDEFVFDPGDFMQITVPPSTVHLCDVDPGDAHRAAWQDMKIDHIGVQWDDYVTRAYSLANRPADTDVVTLMIRLALPPTNESQSIPPGMVSSWLCTRKPGDRLELSGPHQGFHIADEDRELVFVGGGVGMAPLRSMIHRQIERKHVLPMTFFYGARSQADLLYREEFDALSDANNGFTWIDALSEPDPGWQGECGLIHEVLQANFLNKHERPDGCDYYLCGPPLMIRAVVSVLHHAGVQDSHIYKDEF